MFHGDRLFLSKTLIESTEGIPSTLDVKRTQVTFRPPEIKRNRKKHAWQIDPTGFSLFDNTRFSALLPGGSPLAGRTLTVCVNWNKQLGSCVSGRSSDGNRKVVTGYKLFSCSTVKAGRCTCPADITYPGKRTTPEPAPKNEKITEKPTCKKPRQVTNQDSQGVGTCF